MYAIRSYYAALQPVTQQAVIDSLDSGRSLDEQPLQGRIVGLGEVVFVEQRLVLSIDERVGQEPPHRIPQQWLGAAPGEFHFRGQAEDELPQVHVGERPPRVDADGGGANLVGLKRESGRNNFV